ncbi:dTDP-4-amino-4,6-dideoxygalactose transaminase [Fontibacillus phaseoli]|uniref:dTDP-4-amino-4,6-dideoxygalactose transaminase n=1 Tax=Fontibacillus phaseoli TaxID=1416533 RepID=A0A369B9Q4_9BACL|nr:DegT/DnrJ/EryC1/StrS family aminotransferase [Fontibacillus phaseoli]RCX17328.1 dTDP-4-amino-4,6-dideoxygalactose transaminase [Fontibacillus phaseoli]
MGILFSAPQIEFQIIRERWLEAVEQLAKRGVFVGGPSVGSFEQAFASFSGSEGSVGLGNGTDALYLALKALGIGHGDEVITATNTFIATVEAIHHTGATPVLVDCCEDTFLIDIEQVKAVVTPRTRAIIAVHLYGQMADLSELIPWAGERGIEIIEDCAQAAGARLDGKGAGSLGALGCFSFYPDKNLGAIGDGGAVISSSPQLLSLLRKLRNHGGETRYEHEIAGFNSRLDPIQAIALELKLAYLDDWSCHRRSMAACYRSYLDGAASIIVPSDRGDESHVYHLFVVRVDTQIRETLRKQLQKKGILTAVHYPLPVHQTPAFRHLGYDSGTFPVAEQLSKEIISLPMHIGMTERDVQEIAGVVKEVLGKITA